MSNCIRGEPEEAQLSWTGINNACCYNSVQDALATLPSDHRVPYEVFAFSLLPSLFHEGNTSDFDYGKMLGGSPAALPAMPATGIEPLGFDVVAFTPYRPATAKYAPIIASFDCSPLSCNGMAASHGVNPRCLFDDLNEAMGAAILFSRGGVEPGPYVVVQVLRSLNR